MVRERKVNGAWRWHFEGHELKIATRRGETNVLDIEIDPDVAKLATTSWLIVSFGERGRRSNKP